MHRSVRPLKRLLMAATAILLLAQVAKAQIESTTVDTVGRGGKSVITLTTEQLKDRFKITADGHKEISYSDLIEAAKTDHDYSADKKTLSTSQTIVLTVEDLKGRFRTNPSGHKEINYSDLVEIATKRGLMAPNVDSCTGSRACTCDCGQYLLVVIGIPDKCGCECNPGAGLHISCGAGCPSFFLSCAGVN